MIARNGCSYLAPTNKNRSGRNRWFTSQRICNALLARLVIYKFNLKWGDASRGETRKGTKRGFAYEFWRDTTRLIVVPRIQGQCIFYWCVCLAPNGQPHWIKFSETTLSVKRLFATVNWRCHQIRRTITSTTVMNVIYRTTDGVENVPNNVENGKINKWQSFQLKINSMLQPCNGSSSPIAILVCLLMQDMVVHWCLFYRIKRWSAYCICHVARYDSVRFDV